MHIFVTWAYLVFIADVLVWFSCYCYFFYL